MNNVNNESFIPRIVVVGKTGTGKSHICKEFLSGGDEDFKPGDGVESQTSEFYEKRVPLFGIDGNPPVKLVDTIGYDDNRVDENILSKIGEFCKKWENGIHLIIFTVSIFDKRLEINPFKTFVLKYGENFFDRLIMVLMQPGIPWPNKEYEEKVLEYKKASEEILKKNSIMRKERKLVIFDYKGEKEQIMTYILNHIQLEQEKNPDDAIPKTINRKIFKEIANPEEAFLVGHENSNKLIEKELNNAELEVDLLQMNYNNEPNEENLQKLEEAQRKKNKLFYGNLTKGVIFVMNDVLQIARKKLIEEYVKKASQNSFKKFIPGIGFVVGLGRGAYRIYNDKRDWKKGLFEIGSGSISLIPGFGPWISSGIDALLIYDDCKQSE